MVTLHIPLCYTKDTTYAARKLSGLPSGIRPSTAKYIPVWIFGSDANYDNKRWISKIYISNSTDMTITMLDNTQAEYNWVYYGLENQTITYNLQ
jgi:hypothetical protein